MGTLLLAMCMGLPGWACKAQQKTVVSAKLVYAVCMVESTGNAEAYSPNDAGTPSYGLCQIKMKTARWLGFKGTEAELMHPEMNAYYCAKYLEYNIRRYATLEEAISAYNAGHAVDTNYEYVEKVMHYFNGGNNETTRLSVAAL